MDPDKAPLKLFLAAVIMIFITEGVMGKIARVWAVSNTLALVGIARVLEIGFMLAAAYVLTKKFSIIGLGKDRLAAGLKTGVLWSFGFGILVLLAGVGMYYAGINPLLLAASGLPEDKLALTLFFIIGGVVGPVAEELFFRGICFGYFRKWGVLPAIIVTTGVFVAAHAIKSGVPVPQIVGGVVFALSYESSKSLVSPMIIHVLGNLAIFSISLISG